jgi:hypothetical protein
LGTDNKPKGGFAIFVYKTMRALAIVSTPVVNRNETTGTIPSERSLVEGGNSTISINCRAGPITAFTPILKDDDKHGKRSH